MPLTLPTGLIPQPVMFDPIEALGAARVTDFRFDLLDVDENFIGTLNSVQPGGGVETHTYSSVKGSGRITVTDTGVEIDWLNVRIRPVAILSELEEIPCGVFLTAAPVERWVETGRQWEVELLDKLSILDQDIVSASTFTAAAGTNALDLVADIIVDAGETVPALGISAKTLPSALTWDTGTTRLKVINDVLDAVGYASLFCDREGQYRAEPYVDPADRGPVYTTLSPFVKGETSLMSPEWERDRDIYAVPNRFVVTSQGDGENEALMSIAENMDPNSPFSYQNRGDRWITETETGVEVASQDDLDTYTVRRLVNATSVTSGMKVKHLFLPDLLINTVIHFSNPDAGIDTYATVIITSIQFDPTALCTSELREVAL